MQGRLHSISAPESLRELDGDWTVWIGPEEDWLWERLRADELDANALLHIDYHPLNVLTNGAKITAVLDWTCVRIGPPRADVARTFALLRMVPLTSSGTPLHIQGFRRLLALAWHSGYEQVAGKLGQMAPYYAWAGSFTARDLAAKIGRPNIWLEQRHLNSIRRWTAQQRRLAMSERR